MPFQLISTNGQVQYNVNEYVVDTVNDIKTLPTQRCAMGSIAICIENGEVYILNGKKEWKIFNGSNANSSSSSSGSGADGLSAYQIAVTHGFEGTEEEWLESLIGATPTIGENGNWFINDVDTGISASGTNDYNDLINKPTLNGDVLAGEVEIPSITNENIDTLFNQGE